MRLAANARHLSEAHAGDAESPSSHVHAQRLGHVCPLGSEWEEAAQGTGWQGARQSVRRFRAILMGTQGRARGHSETLSRVFEAGETSRLSNEDKTTFLTQI